MGRLKTVTKSSPCPICGKPDYCFWREREKDPGQYNLYCNRTSEAKGTIVTGVDGNEYVAIYLTDHATIYENIEQREERSRQRVTGEHKEVAPRTYTVIDSVTPLSNERLDAIYRSMMQQLPLYKFHAKYLISEGWNMELIKRHGICSFPVERRSGLPYSLQYIKSREQLAADTMDMLSLTSLKGVPGAYLNDAGRWTFYGKSGIIFPVYDEEGLIYRIRVRLDYLDLPVEMKEDANGFFFLDKDERVSVTMGGPFKIRGAKRVKMEYDSHKGKYRNFSSYKADSDAYDAGMIINVFNGGCEAKNQLLFAASPGDDFRVWWIIEGEKKALYCNRSIHQPFIGLPGVNDYGKLSKPRRGEVPLEYIKKRGCKIVVVAFDADRYSKEAVMMCHERLAELLAAYGFTVYIADWNEKDGKGLDDLLASRHIPVFYQYRQEDVEGKL